MGDLGQNCVKWLMFTFNFIFWIIGVALIAAGSVAQEHYKSYSHFLYNGTVSAPVLLIIVGVFIFIISFLGCWGAFRESYPLLMGFAVVVGLVFVVQLAGGIAGFVQKDKITGWVDAGLNKTVTDYKVNNESDAKAAIDQIQRELSCCGASGFENWRNDALPNTTVIPTSCCKNSTATSAQCDLNDPEKIFLMCGNGKPDQNDCPINIRGCAKEVDNILRTAVAGVAGVAIGLAFIEVVGIVFACYLARRIRNGYTYA